MSAHFVFEGDQLVCERVYFDQLSIMRQLGLAHDSTSLAGRVTSSSVTRSRSGGHWRGACCGVGRDELLLVHHPAEHGRHPGALVEAERAGVARRVDAEPDAVLAALPEAPERVARSAAPTPCLRHGRRVKSAWTQPPPYVSPVQIVPAAISSPARTTHQSAGSKRSLPRWLFDHDSKSRGV